MTAFLVANMAPLMFAALVVFLLFGYPVAFSLAANGLFFGIVAIDLGLLKPELLQALPERVFGIMRNDTLLAIPFFTFMGLILERSGMAEDLLETTGQMFGPVRGGLAYAVVFVGALLAATTGVVAASVISMGLISLPIMLRYGYDRRLAAGVITASGTLAQIIPPSLVLIVMADQLGRSVGDMYQGAFLPGLSLAALYGLFVLATTIFRPAAAPALPSEALTIREESGRAGYPSLAVIVGLAFAGAYYLTEFIHPIWASSAAGLAAYLTAVTDRFLRLGSLSRLAQQVVIVMMPPLALIFLVLGTIFVGIATPTEGGAMGATGALLLALNQAPPRLVAPAAGDGLDGQAVVLRNLHPDRFIGVLAGVSRRQRRPLGREPAYQPARRSDRVPRRGQYRSFCPRVLPRFLRALLHYRSAAAPGGRASRHRSDLVRRAARRQYADLVSAPALRFRPLLFPQCRADTRAA